MRNNLNVLELANIVLNKRASAKLKAEDDRRAYWELVEQLADTLQELLVKAVNDQGKSQIMIHINELPRTNGASPRHIVHVLRHRKLSAQYIENLSWQGIRVAIPRSAFQELKPKKGPMAVNDEQEDEADEAPADDWRRKGSGF